MAGVVFCRDAIGDSLQEWKPDDLVSGIKERNGDCQP